MSDTAAAGPLTLKDLAPVDARLALSVHRFVTDELGVDWRGAGLVIALSAGADSTALLVLLAALRARLNFSLTAAHLDHGLRPESGQDAEAARELCRRLEVPFRLNRCDVAALAGKAGLEEAGRRVRYAFLDRVRRESGADWIVTGHHVGDLAEDMLLRLIRGASWPGLGGMRGVGGPDGEDGERVLRPLLMVEKERLKALLVRRHMEWREDASNAERGYRRNRVRLDVLPLLLAENPGLYDVVRSLWRTARLDENYWRGLILPALASRPVDDPRASDGVWLSRGALSALPRPGRLRAYVQAVRRMGRGQARSSALFALDAAWERRRHGACIQFPGGVCAELSGEGVLFRSADSSERAERRKKRGAGRAEG